MERLNIMSQDMDKPRINRKPQAEAISINQANDQATQDFIKGSSVAPNSPVAPVAQPFDFPEQEDRVCTMSFDCPIVLHQKMKLKAVTSGKNLGDLFTMALEVLLDKLTGLPISGFADLLNTDKAVGKKTDSKVISTKTKKSLMTKVKQFAIASEVPEKQFYVAAVALLLGLGNDE